MGGEGRGQKKTEKLERDNTPRAERPLALKSAITEIENFRLQIFDPRIIVQRRKYTVNKHKSFLD